MSEKPVKRRETLMWGAPKDRKAITATLKQKTSHKVNHRALRDVLGKTSNRCSAGEVIIQWKRDTAKTAHWRAPPREKGVMP
jgi:hypothetical protein